VLRIATFNLESLDDSPGATPPLAARLDRLRGQLARLDADILCLQEINARRGTGGKPRSLSALSRLLEGTAYADFARAVSLGPSGRRLADHHNLAILSRWPIRQWQSLRHDLIKPLAVALPAPSGRGIAALEAAWDRPLLHAVVPLPDGTLLQVIDLHLRAPLAAAIPVAKQPGKGWISAAGWAQGFYLAALKRQGQALEARLLVDRLFDADANALIAVCGDFNAEAGETPLRLLRAAVADSGNPALAGRELIALAETVPEERRFSVRYGDRLALYDHLLVSQALHARFRGLEICNETLGARPDPALGEVSPDSSHAPLVAAFDLGQPAAQWSISGRIGERS